MVDVSSARVYLENFASCHNLSFVENVEISFNCMVSGLKFHNFFVEFNPVSAFNNMFIDDFYFPEIYRCAPHFRYFGHDVLAVRIVECNVDASIISLAEWLMALEKEFTLSIKDFPTGHVGKLSIMIGDFGKCLYLTRRV